jgi:hypothetical protein
MPDEHEGAHVLDRRTLHRGAAGAGLSAAAAALLAACGSGAESGSGSDVAAEGPPEATTIRLNRNPVACSAAQAVASEFLQQEGFTDVKHLDIDLRDQFSQLAVGAFDMHMYPAQLATARVDSGDPIVMLGGVQSAAGSSSEPMPSRRSVTSRVRPLLPPAPLLPTRCCWQPRSPTWASTSGRTSEWSPAPRPRPYGA